MRMFRMAVITLSVLFGLTACNLSNQMSEGSLESVNGNTTLTSADTGKYYVFDDMVFDRSDATHQKIIDLLTGKNDSGLAAKGLKENWVTLWPNGRVEFYYGNTFTAAEKTVIRSAMKSIELVCNVRFVETTAADYRYKISKINNPNIGGQSTLGYIRNPFCDLSQVYYGTAVHEFLHGLGISHEHNRWDRTVTINWNNIDPNYKSQFNVVPQLNGATYYEYDYDSIMHYPAYAFSINGQKTIDAGTRAIGQRDHLSVNDKRTLLSLYGYPSSKLFRLQNRWTGQYMNIENQRGWVEIGGIQSYWWSAQWIIETRDGYMRFKNRWTGQYMHNENNSYYVQVGAIQPYWWSADWLPVEHDGAMRLMNRWTQNYPHIENQYGWLQLGAVQPYWISCDWILEAAN